MSMTAQEMEAVAVAAFNEAENAYDKNEVMALIFSKGVPFNRLASLYRLVGQKDGFIAKPEEITAGIDSAIEMADSDIDSLETYADLEVLVDNIVEDVEGATSVKVLKALKLYAKENEYELPTKTRTTGVRRKGGRTAEAVIAYANANEELSLHGFYKAVRPVVKGPKNAFDCVNSYFTMVYGAKFGKNLDEVNADIAKMEKLDLKALEAAEA